MIEQEMARATYDMTDSISRFMEKVYGVKFIAEGHPADDHYVHCPTGATIPTHLNPLQLDEWLKDNLVGYYVRDLASYIIAHQNLMVPYYWFNARD